MSETLKFKNCPQCKALLSQKNYPNFCPSCGQDLIAAAKDLEGILARIPESARTPVKRSFPWYWLLPIGLVVLMIIAAIASIQTPINPVPSTAIRPTLASTDTPHVLVFIPSSPFPRVNYPELLGTPNATDTTLLLTSIPEQNPWIPTMIARFTQTAASECLRWDQVTVRMNGQTVCIYGMIQDLSGTRYKFSDQPNTFFLYSEYEIYNPADGKTLAPGTCVKITSIIHNQQDVPYMDVDELISGKNFNNFLFSYDAADCQ